MTPTRVSQIFRKEFERCCALCGMTDWMVDYGEDTGNVASVATNYKQKRCTVYLNAGELRTMPAEDIRKVAAHEAAHLLLAPVSEIGPDHKDSVRREEGVAHRVATLMRRLRKS